MIRKITYDSLFILLVTSICHLLFSKYGFNPTDEGFVLSATNRVMHGQIPHVDFSSVRPLCYAYLHIPELLISKSYFFLVSRWVFWLEQVLIAFLWVRFLIHFTVQHITTGYKYALVIICFIFNVHYFPASVLHTTDGLLMCLLGLNLLASRKKWNFAGFIFIGFAALCKQNYLAVLPIVLLSFSRKSIVLNFIIGMLPAILYLVFICFNKGWNDMTIQLGGHHELINVGILAYLINPFTYIGIAIILVNQKVKLNKLISGYLSILFAISILLTNHYHGKFGFIFFGILSGVLLYRLKNKRTITSELIALTLAWSVSISVGYNTPALFIGGIVSWMLLPLFKYKKTHLYVTLLLSTTAFIFVRYNNIYRDSSAKETIYKLDGIVEGANGILTNQYTYAVLRELDSLKDTAPNLIIVPDFTACNILHSHESKILTEWPNKTEIPNKNILEKVTSTLKNDTTSTFAIPVFQTAQLQNGFIPLKYSGDDYAIIRFVKRQYKYQCSTKYFEQYHH